MDLRLTRMKGRQSPEVGSLQRILGHSAFQPIFPDVSKVPKVAVLSVQKGLQKPQKIGGGFRNITIIFADLSLI